MTTWITEHMKHTDEEVTCPFDADPKPGNMHLEMRCEDCDVRRMARLTLGQIEDLYHTGRITQDQFEGYSLAWDLLSPYRDTDRVEIPGLPHVRRIARKLIRAKGLPMPARLVETGRGDVELAGVTR